MLVEFATVSLGKLFPGPVSKIERAELIYNLWQRHEKAASNRHKKVETHLLKEVLERHPVVGSKRETKFQLIELFQ